MNLKTVLVKAYTKSNLGDDLFLKILFERYQNTHFILMAPTKKYKKTFSNFPNLQIINLPLDCFFCKILKRCISIIDKKKGEKYLLNKYHQLFNSLLYEIDAFVYIGGSVFMQHNRGISFDDKLNELIATTFCGKYMYILGANFGPYIEKEYLIYYKKILSKYTDVCFRDKYSYDLFSNLLNIRYAADIVCLLDCKVEKIEYGSVGFSLIDLSQRSALKQYENKYLSIINMLIIKYLSENREVYLFSFCKFEGDENVINEILNLLPKWAVKKIRIVKYDGNIASFIQTYKRIESMFATRFHAMILSLLSSQYVCPLIYSNKMTNTLELLKYKGRSISMNIFNNANIGMDTFLSTLEEKYLIDHEMIDNANLQFKKLDDLLM